MKKSYIIPASEEIRLGAHNVLAASPNVTVDTTGSVDAANVEVKSVSDQNVWNEEW